MGAAGGTQPQSLWGPLERPPHVTETAATSERMGEKQERGKGCRKPPPAHRDEAGDHRGGDTTFQLSPGVFQGLFPPCPHLPVPLLLPFGSIPALRKACQAVTWSLPLARVPG